MAVPLTLDVGLDFDRVLPGEVSPDHAVAERPADAGATARPAAAPPGAAAAARHSRGRLTLDELIVGVWEDLSAHHAAACPVCGDAMQPRYGSGAAPVGGRCRGCGSTLG